jgi:SRSO17 transposase
MSRSTLGRTWQAEFARWLRPFLAALRREAQRHWAPVYLEGLLGPGERKSVAPMAARVAPGDVQQLHHFVATSPWASAPLEQVLAQTAQRLVGGPAAVLIIDDTALPKQGRHSVGVARQYCGALGKTANCQTLVSLTLAQGEVPVPLALRLYLPEDWAADPARRRRVGVPPELPFRPKGQIALAELDRVRAAGVTFGTVLADAGYGTSAEFRQALSARGLCWAVGVLATQQVYPADVTVAAPPSRSRPPAPRRGRPRTHPELSVPRGTARAMLAARGPRAWRPLTWRRGTKGPLRAHFAAVRVRVAVRARGRYQPGEAVWLVGERRASGEVKYYLTNHPLGTAVRTLARAIKARWICEQAHQQMKEELGLDHYEGRSWSGLHHHALLSMIAFAFLQHWRLTHLPGGKKTAPSGGRPTPATHPAGGASHPHRGHRRRAPPMSALPRPPHAIAA